MSVSQDFEARRKARLIRQRKQRERMRKIKLVGAVAVLILLIVTLSVSVSKCSKKDSTPQNQAQVVSVTPEPEQERESAVRTLSQIPEPKVGDNNFLDVLKDSGQKKHVYLTFDDGPSAGVTEKILDVLRRYNVKATFFMIGEKIEANPGLCARVIDEGHLAASHTYSHSYSTVYSDESTFIDEVQKTYELIVKSTPSNKEPFKIFRFPGGASNNTASILTDCKEALARDGYYYCDWNSSNADNENKTKSAEQLLAYFNNTRPDLNNLVIHMHDDSDNAETAVMLESLITQLMNEGYTFSRLDEVDFSNAVVTEDETDEPKTAASATSAPAKASATPTPTKNSDAKSTEKTTQKPSSKTNSTSDNDTKSTGKTSDTATQAPKKSDTARNGSTASSDITTSTNDINTNEHILNVE